MNIAALLNSIEMGMIFAVMALGVYITFRVLNFPDLTVDGSFVTGAAVTAVLLVNGVSPIMSSLVSLIAGFIAGLCTGILHTKGKINPLLSGILMMIALYSINLRIMGSTLDGDVSRPNIPLLNTDTLITQFDAFVANVGLGTYGLLICLALITLFFKIFTDYFLKTEIGLALRATGDNQQMIRSFSANTDGMIILGVAISNAFVAFSGSLLAQYHEFADVNMGTGMIVVGLASIIIGETLFGKKTIFRTTLAVVFGAILYRIIISLALSSGILDASDQKLITAVLVILALVVPHMTERYKVQKRNKLRQKEWMEEKLAKKGEKTIA